MKQTFLIYVLSIICSISFASDELIIGTYISAPFVIQNSDGELSGVSIDLWDEVADELGYSYKIKVYDCSVESLIDTLRAGKIDGIVSSATINSNRLLRVSFTQPYYDTELSIVTPAKGGNALSILSGIFSISFIEYILYLLILLLIMGIMFWLVERRYNEDFSEGPLGIYDGFYYVAVVMSTVGFGDKSPKTIAGKALTILWIFISLGITGIFIGNISSALTVGKLESGVQSIADLKKLKVGSIYNTTSGHFLDRNKIKYIGYNNSEEALLSMANEELDSYVYDTPIIKYYLRNLGIEADFTLSEISLDRQSYGFCFKHGDPKLNAINSEILSIIKSNSWKNVLYQYNID